MNEYEYYFISPQCDECTQLTNRHTHTCKAFPEGIPPEIWNIEVDHKTPYPGDNGIQYRGIK